MPAYCSAQGCDRRATRRGMCRTHYDQERLRVGGFPWPPAEERFLAKVRKTETCWLWIGGRDSRGYGHFQDGAWQGGAHRWAYVHWVGPIPEGLHLDHLCRVVNCVNPAHLEPVTCRENLLRGETFQAKNAAKTHCPQGHAYDEANTYVWNGKRDCRTCHRNRQAVRRRGR